MCPTKGRSGDLREPDVFDLPGPGTGERSGSRILNGMHHSLDELSHCSNSMLDWDCDVGTVKVVEVDIIDSQPRQRLVEGLVDVLRVAPNHPTGLTTLGGRTAPATKLSCKEDLVALPALL